MGEERGTMQDGIGMRKATPVLYVEEVEPCLAFWVDRLGFDPSVEVPHGDAVGFAMLERDGVEVMYQSRASMEDDLPEAAGAPTGATFLFVEVEDLDLVEAALEGVEPVIPRRRTFYGTDELIVRDPGGNVITFARFTGD